MCQSSRVLLSIFEGYLFIQICSKSFIEEMFALRFLSLLLKKKRGGGAILIPRGAGISYFWSGGRIRVKKWLKNMKTFMCSLELILFSAAPPILSLILPFVYSSIVIRLWIVLWWYWYISCLHCIKSNTWYSRLHEINSI